jgi:hypothetical protein
MSRQFFASLPVKDLEKAKGFYGALGATINSQFTGDGSACMVFSEHFFVMVMTHEKWATFTATPPATGELALGLFCDSRAAVDAMIEAAAAQGGTPVDEPQDHGFMYQRSIQDPGGHHWEITWFDVNQMPKSA